MEGTLKPPKRPCGTCPYRRDVPAGIWDRSEYVKLRDYDQPTHKQPIGLFMCHQQNGCLCGGWLLSNDRSHLLALRVHAAKLHLSVWVYAPDVECFPSGSIAAAHGVAGIRRPSPAARKKIEGLVRQKTKRQWKEKGHGNKNL